MAWRAPGGEDPVGGTTAESSLSRGGLELRPFDFARAAELMRALGVSRPTAVALIKRGIETPEQAGIFLGANSSPVPEPFPGAEEAAARIREAIRAGSRISVFGDFDVDGVCATSILISALRRVGAECDWLIPDRRSEGYGLREESLRRLASRGSRLVITVDCGVTAVREVEFARSLGLEVIVTDHHQAGEDVPDCLVLHPRLGNYSCPDLCGAGVAWKLTQALIGDENEQDLDLVALATVSDLMPLRGENRELVRRGLGVARRCRRPGIRALVAAAGCVAEKLSESDLGFRLGPRINAAGRLYRADAGVELFLTADEGRAAEIADELGRANLERQNIERRVLGEAESEVRHIRAAAEGRLPAGIVVAKKAWHPGVIGIVASRLVEQYGRPAVVITIDEEGRGRGSGRGLPGFDLLAAVRACEPLLGRFGGHRAAAGIEIEEADIPSFATAFAHAAEAQLGPDPAPPPPRADAFAAGPELGLDLAEELERLAPFGIGNPGVNLVIPGARVSDPRPMGAEGKHLRFTVHSGGYRASAVAFGRAGLDCDEDTPCDLVMRLERNEWNGSVEPRLRLLEILPRAGSVEEGTACDVASPPYRPSCGDEEWWRRFGAVFDEGFETPDVGREAVAGAAGRAQRTLAGAGLALLSELAASGSRTLAVATDAGRRTDLTGSARGIGHLLAEPAGIASFRDGGEAFQRALERDFCLTDYRSLLIHGSDQVASGVQVVLIDPPRDRGEEQVAGALATAGASLHIAWDAAACDFTAALLKHDFELRESLAEIYRGLRQTEAEGSGARALLEGQGTLPRSAEQCGLAAAILAELGLIVAEKQGEGDCARRLRVVSSDKTDLHQSRLFRRTRELFEVSSRFLETQRQV